MLRIKRKAKGEYDKKSPRIDFSTWNMHTSEKVEALVEKMFEVVLKEAFDIAGDYECYGAFLIDHWDGKGRMPDPDILEISLPIGAAEYEEPTWRFSLRGMVENMVDINECGEGGPVEDPASREGMAAVRDHLRELADGLDKVLNRGDR